MNECKEKAKKIRLIIFDVDGVLTDGSLFYGTDKLELRRFHVHDGLGMRLVLDAGIQIAIITAKQSDIITQRMQDLGIKYVYQGNHDKLPAYEDLKTKLQLSDEEIAYIGDDLPDLPLLRRVGLPITVANAAHIIKKYTLWTTQAKGGKGAAREVCDFILEAKDLYQEAIQKYLQR